ncbi:MAG: patatin-like phospholipase family protein [Balneolaceae bacterium]
MKKKVHLVLGSGGARGIAHIAVIDELEKDGYEIIEVIGCSMGAVIGGIYAAGHFEDYRDWILNLSKKDVFDLMDFTFTKQGFVKGEKIFAKHKDLLGLLNIEDFKIPFTAVATDMRNNEEVHFKSGDLYKALRASGSIPGLYVPVVQDGRVLVDGGVLNPLPINLVDKQDDAIIVAVDLNAKSDYTLEKLKPSNESEEPKWYEKILPDNVVEYTRKHEKEKIKKQEEAYSLLDLMDNTYSFTQDRLTSLMLELHPVDVLVEIPRNTASAFDFDKANEIYDIGLEAYRKAMQKASTE